MTSYSNDSCSSNGELMHSNAFSENAFAFRLKNRARHCTWLTVTAPACRMQRQHGSDGTYLLSIATLPSPTPNSFASTTIQVASFENPTTTKLKLKL